jgi:hypothetical protein
MTGCRYKVCYNIRWHMRTNAIWSIRQAAIHHQFDLGSGNQLWVVGEAMNPWCRSTTTCS